MVEGRGLFCSLFSEIKQCVKFWTIFIKEFITLKGEFTKNERGYRFTAKLSAFDRY